MLDEKLQQAVIEKGRNFMKYAWEDEFSAFESDQDLKKPQPPLVKEAILPESCWIHLPMDFENLPLEVNFWQLLMERKSHRVYTQKPMRLLELSFLLYATQGIKEIRGRSYATLRTVPSGGARHPFETSLLVLNVEGLQPGLYHYLPMHNALEFLGCPNDLHAAVSRSLCMQDWACKAGVIFFWSCVAYRAEWRYGIYAHRIALVDAGHVGENLYLAATALHLGSCAIGAFDGPYVNRLFQMDGIQEFTVYAAVAGCIEDRNQEKEQAFYAFVKEENL